jgi:hypothetical protein
LGVLGQKKYESGYLVFGGIIKVEQVPTGTRHLTEYPDYHRDGRQKDLNSKARGSKRGWGLLRGRGKRKEVLDSCF